MEAENLRILNIRNRTQFRPIDMDNPRLHIPRRR